MTARLTDEDYGALRRACEAAKQYIPGATLALAQAFSVDVMLALLDERDALAAEVEKLRADGDRAAEERISAHVRRRRGESS